MIMRHPARSRRIHSSSTTFLHHGAEAPPTLLSVQRQRQSPINTDAKPIIFWLSRSPDQQPSALYIFLCYSYGRTPAFKVGDKNSSLLLLLPPRT